MKTRLSSAGSAHSPISTYEPVGTYTRPIGRCASSQADGVVVVSQSAFASSASKNRSTQRPLAPAVLPGRRPRAELLAVVAHHPDPVAVLGRVVAQVVDDLLDVAERDPVAEPLLGAEDASGAGPGPRSCTAPTGPPRGSPPPGNGRRRGSSSRSRPRPARSAGPAPRRVRPATRRPGRRPNSRLELVAHPAQLADPVALRQRREDRLVVAAAEDLHLAAVDEGPRAGR